MSGLSSFLPHSAPWGIGAVIKPWFELSGGSF
uniref:Uncharacterized protein n=1 Tax=Anguilla anguilla TaxID=7936 RepID=A0A0E9VW27_ANGAN